MIIVDYKNIENCIYFPKNLYKSDSSSYDLILKNRGTNNTYEFKDLEDEKIIPYDYYTFILNFKDLPGDEYEYTIYSGDYKCGCGMIRLNDKDLENIYYDKNREYITYDKQ